MNKTSWHMLLAFGSAAALAAACTVSSGGGSDNNDHTTDRSDSTSSTTSSSAGTGGSDGTGGSESSTTASTDAGGAAGESGESTSGETGGTGGTGSSPELECLEVDDPTGEPAACENLDPEENSCCTRCAAVNCCDALGACYATDPENVCGTMGGEIQVIQECMLDIVGLPGLGSGSDFEGCVGEAVDKASSPLCGLSTISATTNDLAVCLHGDENGLDGCFEECFNPDFDDADCVYE